MSSRTSPRALKAEEVAAPFFIEANNSRIVAAVEAEFQRAFEDQASREDLNVRQR